MKIQGLKKYCDKEGYIVELIKNKEEIFKDILGNKIDHLHSQVRLNNNKIRVDLLGEVDDGSLVFVELSIRDNCIQDFVTHKQELINILEFIGKDSFAQIFLMSPNFLNDDIKDIEKLIALYNIKVYFVYLSTDVIIKLQNHIDKGINKKSNFIYNKSIVNKCIKVTSRTVTTDEIFRFPLNNEEGGNDISKAILKGIRENAFWHLAVHNYKNLNKNIIRIGTGTSDIMLNIYCGKRDRIRVELDFAKRINVFNMFKDYLADMSDEVGNSIAIAHNNSQIFTEIPISKNNKITIDIAIKTAKGYIEYITKMYNKIQL